MGSKIPPTNNLSQVASADDDTPGYPSSPESSAARLRLRRVAEALQVQPSDLYDLPHAVSAASTSGIRPVALDGGGLQSECAALLEAYRRICDPEERRLFLTLVQSAAKRN